MSGEGNQPVTLTDANFMNEVVESAVPVLVDFWAPWCAPCRVVGPTIEELAGDYDGRVKVAKLNVDENQEIAGALRIMSIPTVALFQGNQVLDYRVGAYPKTEYAQMLDKALTGNGATG